MAVPLLKLVPKTAPSVPSKKVVVPLGSSQHNDSQERMDMVAELMGNPFLRTVLTKVTGSLACAVVLEKILYWHSADKYGNSRLRVKFKDDFWLAKSRNEMMLETGTSLKQYRMAVSTLQEKRIIDYRIGGFQGKPTPFIRLNTGILQALIGITEVPFEPKGPKPLSQKGPNDWAKRAQTNTRTLTRNLTSLLIPLPPGENQQPKLENEMLKTPSSTAAILASLKEKKSPGLTSNTVKSAQELWRTLVPRNHPTVGMLPEFNMVQLGQLAKIVKSVPGGSDSMLNIVIPEWIGYTNFVAEQAGLKLTPGVPNIGFLLKYIGEAYNFAKTQVKVIAPKASVKVVTNPPVKVPEQVKQVEIEDGDEIASADFIKNWKPST